MKKRKLIHWKTIIAVIFAAAGLVIMLMMYTKLKELINQLVYLQDTTNIVLSDVSGMQSSIEKTLKEEASMVESYTIEITDLDFAGKDYEVDVSVIPKEYSENTRVSVYFGTLECPLTLDGYAYTGSIRLPLEKSFDGNVTFLLANGKKKSTEVLEDYDGLGMNLEGALSGKLEDAPVIREDTLSLKSNLQFALDGGKQFQFESLELVALFDEEEIWTQDLFADMAETMQDDSQSWKADRQLEREETQRRIRLPRRILHSRTITCGCFFGRCRRRDTALSMMFFREITMPQSSSWIRRLLTGPGMAQPMTEKEMPIIWNKKKCRFTALLFLTEEG